MQQKQWDSVQKYTANTQYQISAHNYFLLLFLKRSGEHHFLISRIHLISEQKTFSVKDNIKVLSCLTVSSRVKNTFLMHISTSVLHLALHKI